MIKEELIENIKNIDAVESFMSETIWVKRNDVLALTYQLDEPEKPVVPQFVADFYESIKDNIENEIYDLCVQFGNGESELDKDILFWFDNSKNEPIQTLVNMHQFGYEVEKERLYTAKLKLTNEYLHYDKNYKEIRHYKIPDDVANKAEGYHFTEDDLIAYNAWGDNAYEVNEVEDD